MERSDAPIQWPSKCRIFGIDVSATTYEQCERLLIEAARRHQSAIITHMAVHCLVTAVKDKDFGKQINTFEIVAPDGQPVRAALNWFYRAKLKDRCYGPELMPRLCAAAARAGVSVYFYGSTPEVVKKLADNMVREYPGLKIAGTESPPFRALTAQEEIETIDRINASGAGIVFIGLGCPRQDEFAFKHRGKILAVLSCVGAAFDFHAGNKKMAPAWMQRWSLEWLFRLVDEPKRLWKRYLTTNSMFVGLWIANLWRGRRHVASTDAREDSSPTTTEEMGVAT